MRILITAGPTREHLDDVRFLSNASSGRMGFALVDAALAAGHAPTLVLGPVDLAPPDGVPVVRVTSAQEMRDAVLAALPDHDALIMAAAVADYRPAVRVAGKPRRAEGGPEALELEPTLAQREDLLDAVVGGYRDAKSRRQADRLIADHLKHNAIPALRRALADRMGDRLAHNMLAERLNKLGAGDDVPWVDLAIADLEAASCKVRKAAIATLLEKRAQTAVGPLMKLGESKGCGAYNAKKAAETILKK